MSDWSDPEYYSRLSLSRLLRHSVSVLIISRNTRRHSSTRLRRHPVAAWGVICIVMLSPSAFPSTSSSAFSPTSISCLQQAKAVYSCPVAIRKPAALGESHRSQAAFIPRAPVKQPRASRHCRLPSRLYQMAAKASESEDREDQKSSLRLLVKLGGAAITQKQTFETLNEPVLKQTAAALARAIQEGDGCSPARTVIVHGAGSFGHFQAAEGNVVGGGLDRPAVRKGFVGCRLATKKLQIHVLEALVSEGIEAVGISPMGKWTTDNRELHHVWREDLDSLLQEGFVPVLHGDGVFDKSLGCTVLSGDVVMSHLAATERPEICVFLTNVDGVFTKPPEEEGAVLLRHIKVRPDGTWKADELEGSELSASNDGNDTTGGIVKKIEEAACIAREGVPVVIAKAGTEDATAALMLGAAAFASEGEEMLGRPMRGTLVAPSLY